jgi:hypothetical protein
MSRDACGSGDRVAGDRDGEVIFGGVVMEDHGWHCERHRGCNNCTRRIAPRGERIPGRNDTLLKDEGRRFGCDQGHARISYPRPGLWSTAEVALQLRSGADRYPGGADDVP